MIPTAQARKRHPNRAERIIRRVRLTKLGGRDIDLAVARFLFGSGVHLSNGSWKIVDSYGRHRFVPCYTLTTHSRRHAITLLRNKGRQLGLLP